MAEKLTPKQERFCEEYLKDLNAKQAAIRAGYNKKTAKEIGYENLTKPHLMAIISQGKRERSERTKVNADWVLRRLADSADADLGDLYSADGSIKPMEEWPLVWKQGLVSGVDIINTGEGATVIRIRLVDRFKYLQMIGRHVKIGAFEKKVKVDAGDSLVEYMEAARKRVEARKRVNANGKVVEA